MPILENFDPASVGTPLQPLFPQLYDALLRLSPQSQNAAAKILKNRSIRFVLDTTTNYFVMGASAFGSSSGLNNQRFEVGLRAMERCWAAVFGYSVFFKWASDRFNAGQKGQTVAEPSALNDASAALRWAFSSRHGPEDLPWPTDLPAPSRPHADADLIVRTNATATRVIGFILLHELGHFDRFHFEPDKRFESLHPWEKEYEADAWAFRLETAELATNHEKANLATIPFALAVLAGINHREDDEHPSIANRIRRFYFNHLDPLYNKANGSLFNTAQMAVSTPLLALLHVRGFNLSEFEAKKDLDVFLSWWEEEMNKLPDPEFSSGETSDLPA